MSDTVEFWKGEFGDSYTQRNRVDWRARIPFWDKIIQKTGARSVYEVGCNAGWNLSAIKSHLSSIRGSLPEVKVYGEDVNDKALLQAVMAGLSVNIPSSRNLEKGQYELVFTAGVLIHIAPQDLQAFMQRIVDASCDYVLAVEYECNPPTLIEEEVEYRGHTGKLWKRPYGKLYQDMGLTLIEKGEITGNGFDENGVTYWLLRKP